jgi:hypothetical protein
LTQKQGDQKIRKNGQIFQKIVQKAAKSKKAKNICNKAQFESPKHLQQTTFETLKVARLAKNHPIWSPCSKAKISKNKVLPQWVHVTGVFLQYFLTVS